MKAIRLFARGDLRQQEDPLPTPGPDEALVRVKAVGICGSDLHWFSEAGIGDARLDHPLILGHEFAGEIASGPRQGERVAIDPAIPCQKCEFCLQGNPNLCTQIRFAGHGKEDGGLREYIAWPESCLFTLPDPLSFDAGVMLEPLGVAIHAARLGKIGLGAEVGVLGCGPIGLMIVQLARLAGASRVFATDKLPHRRAAARSCGAAEILPAGGHEATEILAATGQRGLDVVFEAAGDNSAVEAAMDAVKPGGLVILAGIPADDRISFTASLVRRKGLTIKLVRRMKHTYPAAIRLVQSGQVDVSSLVTHHFSLEQAQQGFELAAQRVGMKVIIQI